MRHIISRIPSELLKTVRHPGRILRLTDARKRAAYRDARIASDWEEREGFRVRRYETYEDYVRHQAAKVSLKGDLGAYDVRFREALRGRLEDDPEVPAGASVLCLAARIGTEVKAFLDVGCFAVGLDLNPAEGTRHVLKGDFHDLQFPAGSVDIVFTNSLDHALDLDRVIGEVRRVLKPRGLLMIEAMRGEAEGKSAGAYESFHWQTTDALVIRIQELGFRLASRRPIEEPWPGHHLRFRPAASDAAS